LWFFSLKIFVGWKQKDMMEWKLIGFNGYIIVIFHEYNLCSNSKWKIVPSLFFNFFEKVDKVANLQWGDLTWNLVKNTHTMKVIQTYEWEMLNIIIELCGGLKKGLHNMLSSLLIWIIQNLLTIWQVNI
jgi:hypothetical protein